MRLKNVSTAVAAVARPPSRPPRRAAAWTVVLSLAAAGLSSSSTLPVVPGTVASYQFDEGSGTTTADDSGNGYTGTLQNSPSWVPGLSGAALDFAADTSYVQAAPAIPVGSTWTLQCWTQFPLRSTTAGWRTLYQAFENRHHVLVDVNGNLGVYINTFFSSGYNVNGLTGWRLLTAVGSGSQTTFYIDAGVVGTSAAKETNALQFIGNVGGIGQNWGVIDSVRILNGVRTAQDIAADANPNPAVPLNPGQFSLNDSPIGLGGPAHAGFVAKATVSSPFGYDTRLQAQVKPVGVALAGTADLYDGAFVSSGTLASVRVEGIASGNRHWRVRAVDSAGAVSGWISFGADDLNEIDIAFSNADPTAAPAVQLAAADGSPLAIGKWISEAGGVRFEAVVTDADLDAIALQVEVRPVGVDFTGQPTAQGGAVPGGQTAACEVDLGPDRFHWQARAADPYGGFSIWSQFGGNPEQEADFVLLPDGSTGNPGCQAEAAAPRSAGLGASLVLAALAAAGAGMKRPQNG